MHGNRSPTGRGGGRASAALPLLDDVTTSPASRRLASARPALAPKCQLILARTLRRGMMTVPAAPISPPFGGAKPVSKYASREVLPDNLLDHRAVKAWCRINPECCEPRAIEV